MNVLLITRAFDTGGQGIRIARAFENEPGWHVRSMARHRLFHSYPLDLPFRRPVLEEHYQRADVIHARTGFELYDEMAAKYGPKPLLIHYHGTSFRNSPDSYVIAQRARGAIGLVSTLDLHLLAPEDTTWLPAPYDLEWLDDIRRSAGQRRG